MKLSCKKFGGFIFLLYICTRKKYKYAEFETI